MKMSSGSLIFLCLSAIATGAGAESLSSKAFQVKGGQLGYIERNEVYSAWNANDLSSVLKPGMKVMFFGRGEGCDLHASGGPVTNEGTSRFEQALKLTGIPLAVTGKGQRWAPSANTPQCDQSVREQVGDSFVHVNEDPVSGGIGMFTFTGPDQNGRRSFFRQFGKDGKNGTGANANIEGSFVAFRFDWQKGNTVRPWATDDGLPIDQRNAEFRTVQSVVAVSVGDAVTKRGDEPVQAKQQFIAAFINRACFQNAGAKKNLCQLQYLFNVAVYRSGVKDWANVKWFKFAGLLVDPVQGGMPVIHGPIAKKGEACVDQKTGLELYTSLGEASRHDVFKDKTFRVQVSFEQLKNALKIIAANYLKKNHNEVILSDLGGLFGDRWNDPSEWLLLSINVSQEVFNPTSDTRVLIGGSVKEIAAGLASLH